MGVSSRLDILRIGWNQNMSHGQNGWRPLWYSVAFAEALLSHVYQTLEGDMVPSPKEITITVAITEMWRILMGAHMFIYLVNVHLYLSNILHISIKHFTHIYIYIQYMNLCIWIYLYMNIFVIYIYAWKIHVFIHTYIYIIHIYIYIYYIYMSLPGMDPTVIHCHSLSPHIWLQDQPIVCHSPASRPPRTTACLVPAGYFEDHPT
jgi:hypothetical protein